VVRGRLAHRAPRPLEDLLAAAHLVGQPAVAATILLNELASLVGSDPGRLRPDDVLRDLLTVDVHELGLDADEASSWATHGFRDHIEPHAYDLMAMLERLSTRDGWLAQWRTLDPRPDSEEEWLDHIMGMRVADFAAFFSGTMPAPTTSRAALPPE
jgi:PAS domain-containing protein